MKVRKVHLIVLLMSFSFSACFVRSLPDPFAEQREQHLDEFINKNERLKQLDSLCKEIGDVQKFKLTRRSISRDATELYFYFETGISHLQASNNFAPYFRDGAWDRDERSRVGKAEFFKKGDITINIQYGGISGGADIGITCRTKP